MKYITPPPRFSNASFPSFLAHRYCSFDSNFIYNLVKWAKKEYYDMIGYLYTVNIEQAKILESPRYSYLDFIARSTTFKKVVENMNADIWRELDREIKDILIQAKRIKDNP